MRGAGNRGKGTSEPNMDEVEEMLRAAEDDLLLNLTRNTHATAHRAPFSSPLPPSSALDPDLARRLAALKAPAAPKARSAAASASETSAGPQERSAAAAPSAATASVGDPAADEEWRRVLGDDLTARFAALKGASGANKYCGDSGGSSQLGANRDRSLVESEDDDDDGAGGVSKKEVDQVIQWAMDAARLDVYSAKSGGERDDGGSEAGDRNSSDEDDDDDDDEEDEKKPKPKPKPKGRKWFFF